MPVLDFTEREGRFLSSYHKSTIAAYPGTPGLSDPLPIPPLPPGSKISAYASPASPSNDTATVQYTISPDDEVEAGTAKWFDWTSGAVGVDTLEALQSQITGIRFKCTSSIVTVGSTTDFVVVI